MTNKSDILVFDASSVRHIDKNGNLHIERSPASRVQVVPYLGCELPNWRKYNLDPDRFYYGYRCAEELSKPETLASLKGIPIQLDHHDDFPNAPAKATRVGSTGDYVKFEEPFLFCSLHIQDQTAIDHINDNSMRELSLGYYYDPDFTAGETESGQKYDFVMRNIRANHLALVANGRCGPSVSVYDSKDKILKTGDDAMPDNAASALEQKEVDLAKIAANANQQIIDMHNSKGDDVSDDVKTTQDDVPDDVVAELVTLGVPADKVGEALAKIKAALFPAQDAEPEPTKDDADQVPIADAEPEPEPKATDAEPDDATIKDALKACGLDDAPEDAQKAFAEGVKYGESLYKNPDERDKLDREHESEGEENALGHDTAERIAKAVERRLSAKFTAAEETAKSLGRVRPNAYDSAEAIYVHALKQEGINLDKAHASSARQIYLAFMAGKGKGAPAMARDSALKTKPSAVDSILNKINRGY